ncbi:MAG: FeoB small GTPase domain-containing protein [Steroidobacteraceae bacterium]
MIRQVPDLASVRVALVGVPNCGKTALFNRLTGSHQKVANYPGVTVERKEGTLLVSGQRRLFHVIDLPGTYSLVPASLDEAITRDMLLGRLGGEARPELVVCVLDATNLRLSLRLALEVKRSGVAMIAALNMSDLAHRRGYRLDRERLAAELGVPVVETIAVRSGGEARWCRGGAGPPRGPTPPRPASSRRRRPRSRPRRPKCAASSRSPPTASRCARARSRASTPSS